MGQKGTDGQEYRFQRPSLRPCLSSCAIFCNAPLSCDVVICFLHVQLVWFIYYIRFAGTHLPFPKDVPLNVQLGGYHVSAASICTAPVSRGASHENKGVVQSVRCIRDFIDSTCSVLNSKESDGINSLHTGCPG